MTTIRAEYFEGRLCVEGGWLIDSGIVSKSNYDIISMRNRWVVSRNACPGKPALIDWESMPERFKNAVIVKIGGNPKDFLLKSVLEQNIKPDKQAYKFFGEYELPDGRLLSQTNPDAVREYYNNAVVLNAVNGVIMLRKGKRNASNNSATGLWGSVCDEVNALNTTQYPHTLPTNERKLQEKYTRYIREGYQSLIHKNFCNNSSRKVNGELELLILSIYCMSNNPYVEWVQDEYLKFIAGTTDITDTRTGELYNRMDFFNDAGQPITVSASTVRNYINNPKNRAVVDSIRKGYHDFGSFNRPHFHRHGPNYSLSKVSLDDRDLPRKLHNGKRVKAYYAYDVASGALIGVSYSLKKNANLFIECLRDMFRFIDRKGYGLPLEMEVENHLVRQYEEDLMRAGVVFPFVHFCAPTNSQEKHAEHFNRQKKYGYEKRHQDGIGRFYAKLEANKTKGERVYDDKLDQYVIKEKTYSFEELVADDLKIIELYNNGQHRDEKRYAGKSRMQVFDETVNPDALVEIQRPVLLKHIGEVTETTVRRNQYVRVRYENYQLPNPKILAKFKPGDYKTKAYWLEEQDGAIKEVYLYQGDDFICKAEKIKKFNTSAAEKTDVDDANMAEQAKYIAQFDKMVKDGRDELSHVQLDVSKDFHDVDVVEVKNEPKKELDIEALIKKYDNEWAVGRVIKAV